MLEARQLFRHLYTIPGYSASYYTYGTAQVPVEDELFIYRERTLRYIAGREMQRVLESATAALQPCF